MVWIKNRVVACYVFTSDDGDRVECDLELDPNFVFSLGSGETLGGSPPTAIPFGFRAEILKLQPNEGASSGFMRIDSASQSAVLPGVPIMLVIYRMRFELFSDLQMRIEQENFPTEVHIKVPLFIDDSTGRGREQSLSLRHFDSKNELVWKNISTGTDHRIEDLTVIYEG